MAFLVGDHRVGWEFVLVRRDGANAAGILVQTFAGRARGVQPGRDALKESARVRGSRPDQCSALALHLVPGAIRVLKGHALAARQDPVAVATVQPQRLYLAIGDHHQSAVLEAVARLRRPHHLDASHGHRGGERLDLLDHHGAHLKVSVRRLGVHRLDHLPVVRPDEQHVVRLAAGRLHLGIDGDLREPVTVTTIRS